MTAPADLQTDPEMLSGRYTDRQGRLSWAFVGNDGIVRVRYDDGSYTCASRKVFKSWGYKLVKDEPSDAH